MPVNYYLKSLKIDNTPNAHTARIIPTSIKDIDSIVNEMAAAGTTVSEPDILAVLSLFFDVVSQHVADGSTVKLPIANIKTSIGGVFKGPADTFDPGRHSLKINLATGLMLEKAISKAKLHKVGTPSALPVLASFTDVMSGTVNDKITPGGIGKIDGSRLKFRVNDDEGVYLTDTAGNTVKATVIASLTDSEIVFGIPQSLTGIYTLELRRRYDTSPLHIGQLFKALKTVT